MSDGQPHGYVGTPEELRTWAAFARSIAEYDIADRFEEQASFQEHLQQVRADRQKLAMRTDKTSGGGRVFTAPAGTPIVAFFDETHEWQEVGYLSEDGLITDTRRKQDDWSPYQNYGLPAIEFKGTIVEPQKDRDTTIPNKAIADILERNPASAAERRNNP